jgi:predicted amidohydrolase YtcJ
VAVHAIGDEATRDVLAVLHDLGSAGASVEHAQLLRREDLPLFRAAGVTASLQPAHLLDDRGLVDELWAESGSVPFAVRSLLDAGARVVLGRDAPVSPLDPWRRIAAAVHRTDGDAEPWHSEESVSAEEALAASGARRVRDGDAADLVVLDAPRLPETPGGLLAVPVHAVLLDGRWVHGPYDDAAPGGSVRRRPVRP